jgi:hypothetical protein
MNGLSLYRADFPDFPEGPFGLVVGSNSQKGKVYEGQSRRFTCAGHMSVLTPIATEIAICVHVG